MPHKLANENYLGLSCRSSKFRDKYGIELISKQNKMLYIHSIRIFEECETHLRKNLQTDGPFVFRKNEYEDFFAKNISVYAIVGKNGSGKSTLLEIMFRMVNNLSYVLLHDIQRAGAYPLRYVYGIHANLDYELDGQQYRLCCHNDSVSLIKLEPLVDHVDRIVLVDAKVKVPLVSFMRVEYPKHEKYEIDIEQYRELAKKLFYTVVVNYSMQAYVEQDFQDEKTEWGEGNPYSPHSAEESWINGLFHKNDGYMCPIVLNPYRDKGKVDMNREMRLAQQRLESLLIYYKREGKDYIDGYSLNTIKYAFNPEVINGYFSNKRLAELLLATQKNINKETIDSELTESQTKFRYIIGLFKKVMEAKELNFQQQMLETFGINSRWNMDDDLLAAELYLICKMVNIVQKYPTYEEEKQNILLEDNIAFDYFEILNPSSYTEYIGPMKIVAQKIKKQSGHIGLKVRRAKRYILLSQKKSKRGKRQYKLGDEFELSDYERFYWKDEMPNSVEKISELLPPSIFSYEIMLEKTSNRYDDDDELTEIGSVIPIRQMSSGERQFLFTTSTIVYHLQNLRSVKKPSPRYNHFNVILDEVEICFHPEYQRTFVHKLISMLTRLGLNNGESINIWIVTHSPFILSDIPVSNILYLKKGCQQSPSEADNPFGANINDILKQSFFLNHGFMGEFSKNIVVSLCHFLNHEVEGYKDLPSMYKNITWDTERAYCFIQKIGEPLLRTQMMSIYKNSLVVNKQKRIEELKKELEELEHETDRRYR